MPMTCHDRTSTALVFAITLSVAIEPNSRAGQVGAATPLLLFVPCSFFVANRKIAQGTF